MVRHYIVKGRVQGVGFRWFVHREAGARGLKGWVRNTDGGEVEVMVAGSEEKLDELRAELERGSRGSRVDAVYERDLDEAMATKPGIIPDRRSLVATNDSPSY